MVGLKPAPPPPPPPPPPGDTFTYNGLDRLTASTVSSVARTYVYNGDGLLQSRTQSGTTTSFVWDPAASPGALLQVGGDRIVYGLGPLYVVRSDASTLALARDGLGSVRAEVSASAGVSGAFRYGAYGGLSASSVGAPSLLGFAGEYRDPSALIYLRARWYDPSSGRFITRDPLPRVQGPRVQGPPADLNAFAYANANPLMMTDPTGLKTIDDDPSGGCTTLDCQQNTPVASSTPVRVPTPSTRTAPRPPMPEGEVMYHATEAGIIVVVSGATSVAGGVMLITTGAVETSTGVGAVVGLPSLALGTMMIATGAVAVAGGAYMWWVTVGDPVGQNVFGP